MSDSSEEEDLSKFKDAIDTTFVKMINESRGHIVKEPEFSRSQKSDRYLETSTHYNDIRVPEEMQKRIGAKVSEIIEKSVEFVTLNNKVKKRKIKGGVKLFRTSENFLSCHDAEDTYTEIHNMNSKKLKKQKRQNDNETNVCEEDKLKLAAVTAEYILSKEGTKCWKSRRREKLFKYKSNSENNVLTALV